MPYKNTVSVTALISHILLGVHAKGGIIFVSHLYEGSISDKQLVQKFGFLGILRMKLESGEIKQGDARMADKGLDIEDELKKLGLKLNIPPFLKDKLGFDEDDVIKTQTVAQHRIHAERAIRKIKRYRIFHSVIPVTMFGSINHIWTVACLLSNFLDHVLA